MEQTQLDLTPPKKRENRLTKAFNKFHGENPHVYKLFEKYTFQLINAGRKHYSAATVLHRIRWDTAITTEADDGFKIANAHAAFYSRMFMKQHPKHKGFFRTVNTGTHDEL